MPDFNGEDDGSFVFRSGDLKITPVVELSELPEGLETAVKKCNWMVQKTMKKMTT